MSSLQYTSAVGYAALFHHRELKAGFKGFWRSVRSLGRAQVSEEDELTEDIHARLMKSYKEVPEWWYLITLLVSLLDVLEAMCSPVRSRHPGVQMANHPGAKWHMTRIRHTGSGNRY